MSKTRYIAHITFEAKTALKIGSGKADFLQDSPIQKDWNSLPMILGTSLAGVLRKEFIVDDADKLFGDSDSNKKDAKGSKTIISNALILDENEKVHETFNLNKSQFLQNFIILPIREHNAINEKGVTIDKSKYDEEVVYKGSRFKFSLEMIEGTKEEFESVIKKLYQNSFRIGGGSSKGFGAITVVEITYDEFNEESEEYINFTSSLNENLSQSFVQEEFESAKYTKYTLNLAPDDFFMFGSGFGDDDADMTPVYEKVVDYKNKKFSQQKVLIPASSIKGAISHRTTYNYNRLEEKYIEDGIKAKPISSIFGEKKDKDTDGFKGKILISDLYLEKDETKTFDHVSIDRFTGGGIDSALFNEKTIASKESFCLEILLENGVDETSIDAFETTLKEICTGALSLGGATTKGHGIFNGELYKNGEKI